MEMGRRKRKTYFPLILLFLLFVLGVSIGWLAIPFFAETNFGKATDNLASLQKWSYSFQLLINKENLQLPVFKKGAEFIFTIEPGASVTSVSNDLEQQGIIRNAAAFRSYVIYKGLDTQIKAGEYSLAPSMSAIEISDLIRTNSSPEVPFYVYPGWRAEEIAAALPSSGIEVSPDEFLSIVKNPAGLTLPTVLVGLTSLEGYLFPGDYTINRHIDARQLVLTFIGRFSQDVTPSIQAELQQNGLTLNEAIVLASIVQRETFNDAERSTIASVFYNRLAAGMKLETDPTVQYALGFSGAWGSWWKTPLAISDLSVQSEFNTYLISGLPEYPISNPGLPAILAVANPQRTIYFYFRAKCDGSGTHVFAQTYEEHLANACQ
jgi:UPF0755 protein